MLTRAALLLFASLSCLSVPLPDFGVRVISGRSVCDYSLSRLQSLPQTSFITATSWNADPAEFAGPALALIATHCAPIAQIRALRVTARNAYSVEIPFSDLTDYRPILAIRVNRQLLPAHRRGPAWVMYPIDAHPSKLRNLETDGKLIWQVATVEVIQ